MGFAIPTADTNPQGGGDYIAYDSNKDAGLYHFCVHDTEEPKNDGGDVKVIFEVLAPEKAKGKKWNEFLGVFDKDGEFSAGKCNRLMEFAVATGLISREEWEAAKVNGDVLNIELSEAIGRSCCIDLRWNSKGGKDKNGQLEAGFRIYDPFSDAAKDFPKDKEFLKDDPRSGKQGKSAPPANKKKDPPTDAAADFDFDS